MKATLPVLLLTSFGLLAQTPPAPTTSDTNNTEALRRALRRPVPVRTNAAASSSNAAVALTNAPVAQSAPAIPVAPPAVPTGTNESAATAEETGETGVPPAGTAPVAVPPPSTATTPAVPPAPAQTSAQTPAPIEPAPQPQPEEILPAGTIDFAAAELNQVLKIYANLVNRTILRAPNLASPPIVLKTQTPLTKSEAIQALDAVFALSGIAMINVGEKFVKAVPVAQAEQEGQVPSKLGAEELPDLGQYVTHILQLKTAKPSELAPVLQAFGKTKNVLPVDSSQILVIRDYTENVKRMLEIINQIDVPTSSEFISEVIPIKYALAGDIASALNSLSGGGGGTTVGGSTTTAPRTATTPQRAGVGIQQPTGLQQPGGAANPAGTPSGTASFSQRLQAIIRRASTSGDVQVLGQTKIIADERTNSLLIFASRQDMVMIKDIISKLDVVLAQVLIEAIIMEVSLNKNMDLGVSYLQRPQQVGSFTGVGAIRNTDIIGQIATNAFPSGFSYFARVNDDLDITVTAIAGNGRFNVLARPSIQTSHAVPANIFIGNTVPYITGTTYGDFTGASSRSVYQEKSVGISLNVLPLINPDGLVVMDIQQDIEQLGTPTQIDGNDVPTTTKRSASAKVAVKDHDTIILGGFISASKSTSRSGVPFLKDIPLLGYLFRSTSDRSDRVELIVLLRPTVLPTPEAAAEAVVDRKRLMPGVRLGEAEIRADEEKATKQIDKQLEGKLQ